MASTKKLKGGKFQFKRKDGTWSKTKFGSAKAANAARRGSRGGGGGAASTPSKGNNGWGWGRWAKMARTIDVVSGPAQGAFSSRGLNVEGMKDAAVRYTAGMYGTDDAKFDPNAAKQTYGGMGTGLLRDYVRSKWLHVYQGVGQGKFLSGIMAANPELLAFAEVSPMDDMESWNDIRSLRDRAYIPRTNEWHPEWAGMWQSIGLDFLLRGIQKVIFNTDGPIALNRMLPPGVNG